MNTMEKVNDKRLKEIGETPEIFSLDTGLFSLYLEDFRL
jgi:hypothetical protein